VSYLDAIGDVIGDVIPVGRRKLAKIGDRYCIYLPSSLSSIWSKLYEERSRLEVFVFFKEGLEGFLKDVRVMPVGVRRVVKAGDRYLIYLPTSLNNLWKEVNEKRLEVEVLIKRVQ